MGNILKLKEHVKRLRQSRYWFLRWIYKLLLSVKNLVKFFISASYREQSFSKIQYKKHFHQTSHQTETNRYPDLFEICQDFFKKQEVSKILSFGCSTGEEVFSLGDYLPRATIIGTDISNWCIKECLKKTVDKRFVFVHSKSEQFDRLENLNAILCLAVFQHPNNREESVDKATKYLFSQFEKQLILLDKKLKTGGLLLIDHCDFNFLETSIALKYFPLRVDNNKLFRERPLFNKSNQKISNTTEIYRVFLKSKP